jgi:hypothetical protein
MQTITKGLMAAAAAGAMALSATPAAAQYRDRDKGIDAGDVIAGALIIGGIAAVASAAKKDRYDDRYRTRGYGYDNDRRYDRRYNRGYDNSQRAVQLCAAAVQRDVRRYGYRYADVTQIRDVDRERYGYQVKGRLVVDGQRGYGRNDRYDRRRRADEGRFTCDVSRGRVVDIDYRGIRGLR